LSSSFGICILYVCKYFHHGYFRHVYSLGRKSYVTKEQQLPTITEKEREGGFKMLRSLYLIMKIVTCQKYDKDGRVESKKKEGGCILCV